jgi:Helicase associated domain
MIHRIKLALRTYHNPHTIRMKRNHSFCGIDDNAYPSLPSIRARRDSANVAIEPLHWQEELENVRRHGDSRQEEQGKPRAFAVDPVPINENAMVIVPEYTVSQSRLLNEGNEFIDNTISVFLQKKRRKNVQSTSPPAVRRKRQPMATDARLGEIEEHPPALVESSNPSIHHDSASDSASKGLRCYQTKLWQDRFNELRQFAERHGHCLVPHNWKENLPLAKWVKRQRYQITLKNEGKHSTLTSDRQQALEDLGFVWDSHSAVWEERLQELQTFKLKNGHCNVPSTFRENHSLSIWVQVRKVMKKTWTNTIGCMRL